MGLVVATGQLFTELPQDAASLNGRYVTMGWSIGLVSNCRMKDVFVQGQGMVPRLVVDIAWDAGCKWSAMGVEAMPYPVVEVL